MRIGHHILRLYTLHEVSFRAAAERFSALTWTKDFVCTTNAMYSIFYYATSGTWIWSNKRLAIKSWMGVQVTKVWLRVHIVFSLSRSRIVAGNTSWTHVFLQVDSRVFFMPLVPHYKRSQIAKVFCHTGKANGSNIPLLRGPYGICLLRVMKNEKKWKMTLTSF